jgi:hypothetical protein
MDINSIMNGLQNYIIIGLTLLVIVLIIIVIVLSKAVSRVESRYRRFMKGTTGDNIENLVLNYINRIDVIDEKNKSIIEKNKEIEETLKSCLQKTSIIRYKAFENVGSDLSFSIALLDNNDNGFILTGIYGRNDSTTYAKPIDKGLSRYDLSEEEKEVLGKAMGK